MSVPTKEEVKAMVAKLREIKPRVRHFSAFGDDNHRAVDAQIAVLEKDLSMDQIFSRWPDPDSSELDAALSAREWLDDDTDTDPASEWAGLLDS